MILQPIFNAESKGNNMLLVRQQNTQKSKGYGRKWTTVDRTVLQIIPQCKLSVTVALTLQL